MAKRVELTDVSPEEFADLTGDITLREHTKKWRRGDKLVTRLRRELRDLAGQTDAPLEAPYVPFDNNVFDAMIAYQREVLALDTEVDETHFSVPGDTPALLIYVSDLHMGHIKTDHIQIKQDLEWIRNTDGVYITFGGDLIENVNIVTAARGSFHEQITGIDIQKYYMDEMVGYLGREKIMGMILGNHDEWSLKSDAFNPIKYVSDRHGIPYMGAFGFVNVGTGNEEYRMLTAHQFNMGNSRLNLTLGAKRFWEAHGDSKTDATFIGHRHEGASEHAPKQGRDVFFGQAGSYQRDSVYSQRKGFGRTSPKMPGIVVFPDEHHVIGVHNAFKDGPVILRGAMAEWKDRTRK